MLYTEKLIFICWILFIIKPSSHLKTIEKDLINTGKYLIDRFNNNNNNNNNNDIDDNDIVVISQRQLKEFVEISKAKNLFGNITQDYNVSRLENYTDYIDFDNNGTDENPEDILRGIREFIFPKSWTWILIIMHTIVFIIGVVGNILVCVAVYRNHTMRTVTNYFIVNLAVADFLVILFCLPPSVVWDVTLTWFFGIAMCKIVLYLQSVSVTVSVLTLTFISVDRWYAICFPLKFKSTTGRAKTCIGIIWILALACDVPEAISSTTIQQQLRIKTIYFTQCTPTWSSEIDTIFVMTKMILFYLIPLLFMSIAYIQIIKVLWKSGDIPHQVVDVSGRQINSFQMNMNTSTEGQLRSRRKAAKMLVAVVVMFALCYFPVHLISFLRCYIGLKNTETNRAFSLISHWLCYANSAVNPIIYNFMSGKFQIEFRRAFEHCCQRRDRHRPGLYAAFYRKNSSKKFINRSKTRHNTMDNTTECTKNFNEQHCKKNTKSDCINV